MPYIHIFLLVHIHGHWLWHLPQTVFILLCIQRIVLLSVWSLEINYYCCYYYYYNCYCCCYYHYHNHYYYYMGLSKIVRWQNWCWLTIVFVAQYSVLTPAEIGLQNRSYRPVIGCELGIAVELVHHVCSLNPVCPVKKFDAAPILISDGCVIIRLPFHCLHVPAVCLVEINASWQSNASALICIPPLQSVYVLADHDVTIWTTLVIYVCQGLKYCQKVPRSLSWKRAL